MISKFYRCELKTRCQSSCFVLRLFRVESLAEIVSAGGHDEREELNEVAIFLKLPKSC